MRKTHYKVILDVFVHEDEVANIGDRLRKSEFIVDPDQDALDEVGDVIDITVKSVEVTDSR